MKEKPFFACDWAIVDLETTGGDLLNDRITEIGIIFCDADGRVERFSTLVNPGRPIPRFIQSLTGINDAMVADAPSFASLADELLIRLQGRLFIAHNARFDYSVLGNEFRRLGLPFRSEVLCTVRLSRRLYPQYQRHSLDQLIERHQLQMPQRHRALADADALRQFIQLSRNTLGDDAVQLVAEEILGGPALFPCVKREEYDALQTSAGVLHLYAENDALLYLTACDNLQRHSLDYLSPKRVRSSKFAQQLAPQIRRIGFSETPGPFGARLLALDEQESLRPQYRRTGLGTGMLYTLRLHQLPDGMLLISPANGNEDADTPLFGMFRTRQEMKQAALTLCEAYQLCPQIYSTNGTYQAIRCRMSSGRPCYCRRPQGGAEIADHNQRLLAGLADLRHRYWSYAGAVAVCETAPLGGKTVEYIFDNWRYLGWRYPGEQALHGNKLFNVAVYKLLAELLRQPTATSCIRELTEPAPSAGYATVAGVI